MRPLSAVVSAVLTHHLQAPQRDHLLPVHVRSRLGCPLKVWISAHCFGCLIAVVESAELAKLAKEDVLAFFSEFIAEAAPLRKKLMYE